MKLTGSEFIHKVRDLGHEVSVVGGIVNKLEDANKVMFLIGINREGLETYYLPDFKPYEKEGYEGVDYQIELLERNKEVVKNIGEIIDLLKELKETPYEERLDSSRAVQYYNVFTNKAGKLSGLSKELGVPVEVDEMYLYKNIENGSYVLSSKVWNRNNFSKLDRNFTKEDLGKLNLGEDWEVTKTKIGLHGLDIKN